MKHLFLLLAFAPSATAMAPDSVHIGSLYKSVSKAQEKCLAVTIYGEARGESQKGKIAVAYTILNRAVNRTLCQVALAPKQYSIFNDNPRLRAAATNLHIQPDQKNIIDQRSWQQSLQVAKMVLNNFVIDPTHGATHYLAPGLMKVKHYRYPKWSKQYKLVAVIDGHKFYKNS